MKLIRKNNKKGFTLVELIVVIAIIGILALILVPALSNYLVKSNKAAIESSARSVYTEVILDANDEKGVQTSEEYSKGKYVVTLGTEEDKAPFPINVKTKDEKYEVTVDKNGVIGFVKPAPTTEDDEG